MPRLTGNNANPVAGTFHCGDCGKLASVFVIQKQKRRGTLYVRCGCGCDQRTGAHIQAKWRAEMEARPGFEWVKAGQAPPYREPEPGQDWQPGEPERPVQDQVRDQVQEPGREPMPVPNQVQDGRERLRQALRDNMR
jgi:hypothetical protein